MTERTEGTERIVANGHRYYVPAAADEDVRRALQVMSRWTEINDGRHQEKRCSPRTAFSAKIVFAATIPSPHSLVLFPAWGRNLSVSGVGALCSPLLESLNADGKQPLLALPTIYDEATSWQCGLCLSPTEIRWMDCKIVRFRAMPSRLFDLGVKFLRRSDSFPANLAPEFHRLLGV